MHLSLRRQQLTRPRDRNWHTCPIVSIGLMRGLQLTIGCAQYFYRSVEDGKRKCELTRNEADLLHVVNSRVLRSPWILFRVTNILHCVRTCACLRSVYCAYYYSAMFIRLIPTCATWTRRERKLFFHTWRHSSYLRLALVALLLALTYAHMPWDKHRDSTETRKKDIWRTTPRFTVFR